MIEALGEEPVGHAEQVGLARAHDVLRIDALAAARRDEAGHHVGYAVDARQAAVAAAAEAARPARPVQLGAAREDGLVAASSAAASGSPRSAGSGAPSRWMVTGMAGARLLLNIGPFYHEAIGRLTLNAT